jgi:predicted phage tail protein
MTGLIVKALDGEILSAGASVRVVGKTHPLRGGRISLELEAGLSVAELLDQALAGFPELRSSRDFAVHVDGHAIEERNWHRVRIKPGRTLTFWPRLHGGSLRTILGLVVAVAALVIAPWIAGPALLGLTGTALSIGTALIAGGIVLAGSLALNALFPVAKASVGDGVTTTALNSIQGASNQANPFGPIPVVLGTHRQSPYYAAKPYTEIVGDDQYLRLLFCLGYGPLAISELQLGETPLASFTDVETEIRQGLVGDAAITLYPGEVDEQSLSIKLTSAGGWQVRTTAAETDEISIDVTAPQGIFKVNTSTGALDPWEVDVPAQYRLTGSAGAWLTLGGMSFVRSTGPHRMGVTLAVPRGQYDVRVEKLTADANDTNIHDEVDWTALRSIKKAKPITFPKPLALVAMRIKATGQLSGIVSNFNCICSSLVTAYSGAGSVWNANTASQNPADLFRWVLQGPSNARPVADALIDLANLQAWWGYCAGAGFEFNQVINSVGSVYDKLCEIAAAGRAVPTFIDGQWGVIWDRPADSIVQHFTPRNSWGFQGQKPYAQQPHGWRVSFINEANGYTQDERIVYDDGFDASNATLFEGISFPGVTDPAQIWKHGRFQIAQARLRPEKFTISVGWENLICTRGDRVAVTHDVLMVGLAAGRVKSVAGQVVTFDETVTVEAGKTYGMSFRLAAQTAPIVRALDVTAAGDYNSLTLVGDLTGIAAELGCLFAFGETAQEYAVYRVQGIAHQKDLIAALTLVDDAQAISTADSGVIPAYTPNISIPADLFTLPPRNLRYQEVIDGTGAAVRALVRLTWQVPRFGSIVSFEVQQQDVATGAAWVTVDSVPAPRTMTDVPLIASGSWNFRVRCNFSSGQASDWTTLLGLTLAGLSAAPGDVTNLHLHTVDGQTVLDWNIVSDQRILNYEVRKGSSWDTGLVVGSVLAQPPWPTTGDGVYFVRAYILSPFGIPIYSAGIASITVVDSIIARNIIVSGDEQVAGWLGGLDGGVIDGSFIRTDIAHVITTPAALEVVSNLALSGLHVAVYISPTIVDIGKASECRFWTEYEAVGNLIGADFLSATDLLSSLDILGASPTRNIRAFPIWRFAGDSGNDIFAPGNVFAEVDIFTAGIGWQDWVATAGGTRVARYFRPGFVLITDSADTNATGTKLKWFVDVPDRTDDYTELTVPNTGLALTFYPGGFDGAALGSQVALPFNGGPNGATVPHVQRAIVNATNGDEVKITALTLSGCTVNVVNAGANVTRSGVNLLVRGF